jgi:hypothetical protein
MRRLIVSLLLVLGLASLAGAEPSPTLPSPMLRPAPGASVEMPFLIVPMSRDGELIGYAYISSKLVCTSPNACVLVKEKLAFLQDAFVREVNLAPVSRADDPKAVDIDLLNARLTAAARRVVGVSRVARMFFMEIKFAPLHPGETTAPATPNQAAPAPAAAPAAAQGATSGPAPGPAH